MAREGVLEDEKLTIDVGTYCEMLVDCNIKVKAGLVSHTFGWKVEKPEGTLLVTLAKRGNVV
jgi:hypothetical protein